MWLLGPPATTVTWHTPSPGSFSASCAACRWTVCQLLCFCLLPPQVSLHLAVPPQSLQRPPYHQQLLLACLCSQPGQRYLASSNQHRAHLKSHQPLSHSMHCHIRDIQMHSYIKTTANGLLLYSTPLKPSDGSAHPPGWQYLLQRCRLQQACPRTACRFHRCCCGCHVPASGPHSSESQPPGPAARSQLWQLPPPAKPSVIPSHHGDRHSTSSSWTEVHIAIADK